MNTLNFFIVSIGIIFSSIFLFLKIKKEGISAVISKTFASLFFVLSGLCASFSSEYYLNIKYIIIVGLLFGMLGDIFLGLKGVYESNLKEWLFSGFISFMIGHICYIMAIILVSKMNLKFIIISIIIGIILGSSSIFLEKLLNLNYGIYKKTAFIYGSFLSSTVSTSLISCLITGFKDKMLIIIFIGSILFLISDLILSNTYFGLKNNDGPIWIISNHITYYLAQYLISLSILFI